MVTRLVLPAAIALLVAVAVAVSAVKTAKAAHPKPKSNAQANAKAKPLFEFEFACPKKQWFVAAERTQCPFLTVAEERAYGTDYCGPRGVKPWREEGQRRLTSCTFLGHRQPPDTAGFCFGYEKGCDARQRYGYPTCPQGANGRSYCPNDMDCRLRTFWNQADYGLVDTYRRQIQPYCTPLEGTTHPASLNCSDNLKYCRGSNIFIDLTDFTEQLRRNVPDLSGASGLVKIGGGCLLDRTKFSAQHKEKGELQSWWQELAGFNGKTTRTSHAKPCDVWIDKTTYFLKLDAGVNMYHHFCDFVNLYLTQHIASDFNRDVNLFYWDPSTGLYGDFFREMWQVFTDTPIHQAPPYTPMFQHFAQYAGKKVCFRDVIFPVLPRTILGLFYNMALEENCHTSSLIRNFADHVLSVLNITVHKPPRQPPWRVTMSHRAGVRRVVNDRAMYDAMVARVGEIIPRFVDYAKLSWREQLYVSANTDLYIGIHGAGMTHSFFQPQDSVMFELWDCKDYSLKNLARLAGATHVTFRNSAKVDQINKTIDDVTRSDYAFDVDEFVRLVERSKDALWMRRHGVDIISHSDGGQ